MFERKYLRSFDEEKDLIQSIIAGDNKVINAFLFERCRPKWEFLVYKFPTLKLEVNDIINIAYIHMREYDWSALRSFRSEGMSLENYLGMIVSRNLAKKLKKALVRENALAKHAEFYAEFLNEKADDASLSDRKELLFDLLQELPRRDQEVLIYYYIHGISVNEIGKRLNMKPSSVYVVASRAIKKLRSLISHA